MAQPTDLAKMVPGFEFLQSLMKGAGAGIPGMSQWIAPTLDPAEIDKRIQELKTVQFWLDSNAKLLGTTIQALEVQRMTLATLQTMNLPMAELRNALKASPPPAAKPEPEPEPEPQAPPPPPPPAQRAAAKGDAAAEAPGPATPLIDPMKWWTALTQQFGELASQALKDVPGTTAPPPAPPPAPARKAARKRSG